MPIKPINPVAKYMAQNRRRMQVVKPKKGKGSYDRNKFSSNEKMENYDETKSDTTRTSRVSEDWA